jgi:hypothetical protein
MPAISPLSSDKPQILLDPRDQKADLSITPTHARLPTR